MSGRKPRSVANPLESAITTPSERILKECHGLYVDSDHGNLPHEPGPERERERDYVAN